MLLTLLLAPALAFAGCLATGDAAEPDDGGTAPGSDNGSDGASGTQGGAQFFMNGQPCDDGTAVEQVLTWSHTGLDQGETGELAFEVPERPVRLVADVQHDPASAGEFELAIDGPSGNVWEWHNGGVYAHGLTFSISSRGESMAVPAVGGTYTMTYTGTGLTGGLHLTVDVEYCL